MSRLTQLAGVLSLAPTLAHEGTHWAIARTQTDDAQIAVEVTGGRALAAWPPIDNPVMRFLAFLGPTVFGSMLTALWIYNGVSLDGWRLLMAIGLAIYTTPSHSDLTGAFGRQDVQQEM